MTFQQKAAKIASFLPPNKEIFATYVQFETVQQVPETLIFQFLDDNLNLIAKMMAETMYQAKQADQIQQCDIISDLEEFLSNPNVKFKLRQKEQPKTQKIDKNAKTQQSAQRSQQSLSSQHTPSPKPQRIQQKNVPVPHSSTPSQKYNHSRPQTTYQAPPPQGRQNTIKYTQIQQQPQISSQWTTYSNQSAVTSVSIRQQQYNIRRAQYQKQNLGWIDSLSKCLTYPEKRFYILPEMHPRRKF